MKKALVLFVSIAALLGGVFAFLYFGGPSFASPFAANATCGGATTNYVIHASRTSGAIRVTESDVRSFLSTHSVPPQMSLVGRGCSTIMAIKFETNQALKSEPGMRGETVDGSPDRMIVYVRLRGPFDLSQESQPFVQGRNIPRLQNSNTATEVFDAQTGVILLAGTP
jgi:hypothetical protein